MLASSVRSRPSLLRERPVTSTPLSAKRMAECRADAAGVSDDRRAHLPLRYEGWQMARNQRDVQFAL